jgi:hypothetical protein
MCEIAFSATLSIWTTKSTKVELAGEFHNIFGKNEDLRNILLTLADELAKLFSRG